MKSFFGSLRVVAATLVVCCVGYPVAFLALGQVFFAENANGQLVRNGEGVIVGSRQIAQAFSSARYFWPRPSAVDYNGVGSGGSNLAPTNPALAERARELLSRHAATSENPLPAELATASGSGLDPHITAAAARFQTDRVARARGVSSAEIGRLIDEAAFANGGRFARVDVVNVLELNLALDRLGSSP